MAIVPESERLLTIERKDSEDGTPTLVCKGRLNLESANHFRQEVKALSSNHGVVLVDMNGIGAVDSTGLGSILGTYVSAKNEGCQMVLVNVNPRVRDLLNVTKLTTVLSVR